MTDALYLCLIFVCIYSEIEIVTAIEFSMTTSLEQTSSVSTAQPTTGQSSVTTEERTKTEN